MKTILAALDFSPSTPSVVTEGARLARAMAAQLVLFHVLEEPMVLQLYANEVAEPARLRRACEDHADAQLIQIEEGLHQSEIVVQRVRVTGDPRTEIVAQARKLAADLIVIGSHGPAASPDFLASDTAAAVLKCSTCPVVVVPGGWDARTRDEEAGPLVKVVSAI